MEIVPSEIKKIYQEGKNISSYLKNKLNIAYNSDQIIELSYDLQTGSYQNKWAKPELQKLYKLFTKEIADIILSTLTPNSIMEAGIGEATTFCGVLDNLPKNIESYGFDISYSRISFAKKWLEEKGFGNTKICTGNLFDIPFLDSSIDVIYTYHSIEPNGGNEEAILKELYRVTKKYLILFEPDYNGTNKKNRARMDSLGYCKDLKKIALKLGYIIVSEKKFINNLNDNNPTSITIIKKNIITETQKIKNIYACPKYKTPLKLYNKNQAYYSEKSLLMYPIIDNIPCLRIENGILASKLFDNKYNKSC